MSILSQLKPPAGSKRAADRVGRGPGSGNGKTAGRGQKGQGARSGGSVHRYFEGGQMPMQRRLPKRGFYNRHAADVVNVNVSDLERFDDGTEITLESLRAANIIKGRHDLLKVLGNGDLSKKLIVKAHAFSAGALEKIAKAGGSTEILPRGSSSAGSDDGAKAAEGEEVAS